MTLSEREKCLNALAEGENRFKVKINKVALNNMSQGFDEYDGRLDLSEAVLLVDYSINSRRKRAYLIDLKSCDVLAHEYVAHGGAIYTPRTIVWSEPKRDGNLETCVRTGGVRQYMTRPGFYVTAGCHVTQQKNWTRVYGGCHGIKLQGLEKSNKEAIRAGIVLHEHTLVPNTNEVKPIGQGCPIFPPGRLKAMTRFGIQRDTLVYLYVPQCRTLKSRWY